MRCLAVCQDELVIRMLDEILLPGFEVEFIVENRPLARRLHDARRHGHVPAIRGRTDTWLKADLTPGTCVIIEDNGRRSLEEDSRGGARRRRHAGLRARHRRRGRPPSAPRSSTPSFPTSPTSSMSELFGGPLLTEFSRSLTRARVQQYQRYLQRRRPRADHAAQRSGSRTRWPAAWRCATCCAAPRRRRSSARCRA